MQFIYLITIMNIEELYNLNKENYKIIKIISNVNIFIKIIEINKKYFIFII